MENLHLPSVDPTASFWLSQPSKILTSHRTTKDLPASCDYVIIGSGITGAFAAHWLKEASPDAHIVMLEAREASSGATGRNGGHCQPALYSNTPDIGSFEIRNYDTIKTLIVENNIPCDWKTVEGVHAYMSKTLFDYAAAKTQKLQNVDSNLSEKVQILTESTKPSLVDVKSSKSSGAIKQQHAASLWPYKLVCWILESLLSSNNTSTGHFNLQTNTPVTQLQRSSQKSAWSVHTPRGQIQAQKVLLCTNAYSSSLLPILQDIIVPVRGQMSALLPRNGVKLDYAYGYLGNLEQNLDQDDYLIQRPYAENDSGGELMYGGGRAYAKDYGIGISDDSTIDELTSSYLRREISNVVDIGDNCDGAAKELEASHIWTGIMGFSRDGFPWVGQVPEQIAGGKELYISAGYSGHGMPNAALCAKAAVKTMLGHLDDVDLPKSYWISEERLVRAKEMQSVMDAEKSALRGP